MKNHLLVVALHSQTIAIIPIPFLIRYHIIRSTTLPISVLHLPHPHLLPFDLPHPSQPQISSTSPYHIILAFPYIPPQALISSQSSLELSHAPIQISSSAPSTVPAHSPSLMSVATTVPSSMHLLPSTASHDTRSTRFSAATADFCNPQMETYKRARSVDSSPQMPWPI